MSISSSGTAVYHTPNECLTGAFTIGPSSLSVGTACTTGYAMDTIGSTASDINGTIIYSHCGGVQVGLTLHGDTSITLDSPITNRGGIALDYTTHGVALDSVDLCVCVAEQKWMKAALRTDRDKIPYNEYQELVAKNRKRVGYVNRRHLKDVTDHGWRHQNSQAEQKARRTLRDMLSEREYFRFLSRGAVDYTGMYGIRYFIRPRGHIHLFQNNRKIGELCIHTSGSCPDTDHIINMLLTLEAEEEYAWKNGNFYSELTLAGAAIDLTGLPDTILERIRSKRSAGNLTFSGNLTATGDAISVAA